MDPMINRGEHWIQYPHIPYERPHLLIPQRCPFCINGWKNLPNEYNICHTCYGSGRNSDAGLCLTCQGRARVPKPPEKCTYCIKGFL